MPNIPYLLGRLCGIIVVIGIPYIVIKICVSIRDKRYKKNNNSPLDKYEVIQKETSVDAIKYEYKKAYEPKYLMTLNEKSQFRKLQNWAQKRKLIVFSKVRLLDLITPRKDQDNYKGLLWKIQAKHVDFVICDQNIKVKCIVEISDGSHNRKDRQERDKFVIEVLEACGYKVLQTYNITEEQLDKVCGYIESTTDGQNQP